MGHLASDACACLSADGLAFTVHGFDRLFWSLVDQVKFPSRAGLRVVPDRNRRAKKRDCFSVPAGSGNGITKCRNCSYFVERKYTEEILKDVNSELLGLLRIILGIIQFIHDRRIRKSPIN